PTTQLNLIMQRLDQERRGIILFHDTRPQTAAMLPEFLARLKAKGYRIVHIVPASGEANRLRNAPVSWTSETETILARVMPRLLHQNAGALKVKHEKPDPGADSGAAGASRSPAGELANHRRAGDPAARSASARATNSSPGTARANKAKSDAAAVLSPEDK
ncbi:MAG: polysaccharide deacetylase, partial [Hyphomicrobiales bacterium]|nr:polysaccharide deacetylase [Hyphomicrobiales bacterium]